MRLRVSRVSTLLAIVLGAASCTVAPPATTAGPMAPGDSLRQERTAPGVVHTYRWVAAGPWAIHVVEADLGACGLGVRTVKALDRLAGRETTSQLAAHLGARSGRPVLAMVNGDFFTLKGAQGVPLAAQAAAGALLHAGSGRPVFAMTRAGVPWFGVDRLQATLWTSHGESIALARVNARPTAAAASLYDRAMGDSTPVDSGAVEVVADELEFTRAPGDTVLAIVRAVDLAPAGVAIGERQVVLAARGEVGERLRAAVVPGDTIRWVIRFAGAPGPLAEVIGGSAQLVADGRSRAPFPSASDTLRHPRTAIGVSRSGRLLLVTVDGRQPGYSAGMTLAELATLFLQLDATAAMNLDGGGSTAMVIDGRVVNRPSDASGERPVGNAIGVVGPEAGRCP
jgi:hypothetical protein